MLFEIISEMTANMASICVGESVSQIISQYFSVYSKKYYSDMEGNRFACGGGTEGPLLMLMAEIPEYALLVERIHPNGMLSIKPGGNVNTMALPGMEVCVHGNEVYRGVIGSVPPHLQAGYRDDSVHSLERMHCDTGRTYEELSRNLPAGARINFCAKPPVRLMGGMVASPMMEALLPAAAMVAALKGLSDMNAGCRVVYCLAGNPSVAIKTICPDGVVLLETVCRPGRAGEPGYMDTLQIATGGSVHPGMYGMLLKAAEGAGVACNTSADGGVAYDAGGVFAGREGLAWEIRSMQGGTPVGVVRLPVDGIAGGMCAARDSIADSFALLASKLAGEVFRAGKERLCLDI